MTKHILIIFLVSFLSRLLLHERYPSTFDSITYALGAKNYNIHINEPGFPGYFLYVIPGKLLSIFFGDPYYALGFITVLFGAGTVVTVYLLGKNLFSHTTGTIASILYLTSGTFLFLSGLTLPYIVALFFHSLVILGIVKIMQRNLSYSRLITLSLAILMGIRPHEVVNVFLPLVFHLKFLPRKILIPTIIQSIFFNLLWIIPLLALSGGLTGYLTASQSYASDLLTPSLTNTLVYSKNLAISFITSFTVSIPLFFYPIIRAIIKGVRSTSFWLFNEKSTMRLFILWILPITLFQILIKSDHPSHTLALLLPTTLILARLIMLITKDLLQALKQLNIQNLKTTQVTMVIVVLVAISNLSFYFRYYNSPQPPYITYSFIHANDQALANKFSYIKKSYNPRTTLIISNNRQLRIVGYFLPDYEVITFENLTQIPKSTTLRFALTKQNILQRSEQRNMLYKAPSNIDTVVIFDEKIASWTISNSKKMIPLTNCCQLGEFRINQSDTLQIDYRLIKHQT